MVYGKSIHHLFDIGVVVLSRPYKRRNALLHHVVTQQKKLFVCCRKTVVIGVRFSVGTKALFVIVVFDKLAFGRFFEP